MVFSKFLTDFQYAGIDKGLFLVYTCLIRTCIIMNTFPLTFKRRKPMSPTPPTPKLEKQQDGVWLASSKNSPLTLGVGRTSAEALACHEQVLQASLLADEERKQAS